MVKRNKLSSAISIALLATAVFALPGCSDEEGDEDNSVSTVVTEGDKNVLDGGVLSPVEGLTATVTGTVQDTNGNPLAGVNVFVLGRTTTTDAGGVYVFEDVPVTETNLVSMPNGAAPAPSPLKVTIAAPAGYLGATVNVNPVAEIDGNIGAGSGGGFAPENPTTTIISDYVAPAGVTVLPAYNSSLTGVALSAISGQPMEGLEIRLDMVSVATGTGQEDIQNTLAGTSYATPIFSAVTAADGSFNFPSLPGDAVFNVYSTSGDLIAPAINGNNNVTGQNGQLNTSNEGAQVMNFAVTPAMAPTDAIAPFVTNVTNGVTFINRVAPTRIPGGSPQSYMLARGMDGTAGKDIVLWFNETMKGFELTENSVVVRVNQGYATPDISLAADGMSMTLTFATAIPENSDIAIYLATVDFYDLGANQLVEATTAGVNDWDVLNGITNNQKAVYVRYDICTYVDPIIDAVAGSIVNIADTGWGTDADGRTSYSNSFLDIDGDWGHNQVNLDNDAYLRLTELAMAQVGPNAQHVRSRAHFQFTQDKAAYHTFNWLGSNDIDQGSSGVWDPATSTWTSFGSNGGAKDVTVPASGIGKVQQIWVQEADNNNRVLPGQRLEVTSFDDFGVPTGVRGANTSDVVKPTTVLQDAYGIPLQMVQSGTAGVAQAGDGGELSQVGAAGTPGGTPILGITIPLLDVDGDGILDELTGLWTLPNSQTIPARLYDDRAFASFSTARTMAVAFSEDINLVDSVSPSFSGVNATLNNFVENNNSQTLNHDGGVNLVGGCQTNGCTVYASDLVQFDVSSVFALANADHNSVLNFNNAVSDNFGNTADAATNARVVVRDYIPPMVADAWIDSSNVLHAVFNERIVLSGNSSLTIRNNAETLSATADLDTTCGGNVTSPSLDTTGTHLTLSTSCFAGTGTFASSSLFDINRNYDQDNNGSIEVTNFGRLDFGQVRDERGNFWDNVALHSTNGAEAANTNGGIANNGQDQLVNQPDYALILPIIQWNINDNGTDTSQFRVGQANGTMTLVFNFTSPVAAAEVTAEDTWAEVGTAALGTNLMEYVATGFVIDDANSSASWNVAHTTLTLTIRWVAAIPAGAKVGPSATSVGFLPEDNSNNESRIVLPGYSAQ